MALAGGLGLGGWCAVAGAAAAAPAPELAFPYYRAEQAVQGLRRRHLLPRAQRFAGQARALAEAASAHAQGGLTRPALYTAWQQARLAWMALAQPALGPLLTRRSQREIDFWPLRPALLQQALQQPPQDAAQLQRVGAPAKGFPAIEALLAAPPAPGQGPYLVLLAEAIDAEAQALLAGFEALAAQDLSQDEDAARAAHVEWINQWLGALEQLRWQQIEQPLQRARSAGLGRPPFARLQMADNRADWQLQWQTLLALARLQPAQRRDPPQPGQALLPIEALLLGKGHMRLAARWGHALDAVSARMAVLPAHPRQRELRALAAALKAVRTLYQAEVATALDVPLGFSSADGD